MSAAKTSMNCRLFEEILADLDRPEALPTAMREAALAHAETCPECGLLLTESESLERQFDAMRATARGVSVSPKVATALLTEFREHYASERRGKLRSQLAALGVAAAAALAVSLALGGHGLLRRIEPNPQKVKSVADTTVPEQAQPRSSSNTTVEASIREGTVHESDIRKVKLDHPSSRANAPVGATSPAAEDAAFIRLPYADSSAEIEGGQVVRVILSPAALESLGVQTSAFIPTENVSADLLLDEDGTPEAIRLVAQADNGSISN